jgi:hypothetical protein
LPNIASNSASFPVTSGNRFKPAAPLLCWKSGPFLPVDPPVWKNTRMSDEQLHVMYAEGFGDLVEALETL